MGILSGRREHGEAWSRRLCLERRITDVLLQRAPAWPTALLLLQASVLCARLIAPFGSFEYTSSINPYFLPNSIYPYVLYLPTLKGFYECFRAKIKLGFRVLRED